MDNTGTSIFNRNNNSQGQQQTFANGSAYQPKTSPSQDPFDAEWAALASRHQGARRNTNPFTQNAPVKAFEVQM